jgi:hypothetical protein
MKACPHGQDFIRFPMELNGKYCYGNALYAILEGAGYSLHWAKVFSTIESLYFQKKRSKSPCEECQGDEEGGTAALASEQFIKILKRSVSFPSFFF